MDDHDDIFGNIIALELEVGDGPIEKVGIIGDHLVAEQVVLGLKPYARVHVGTHTRHAVVGMIAGVKAGRRRSLTHGAGNIVLDVVLLLEASD